MGEIQVRIRVMSIGRTYHIALEDDMLVEDVVQTLAEDMGLSATSASNLFVRFESGVTLDLQQTFAANDVVDGDYLYLGVCGAYGCPTADELPGIVPECMLVQEVLPENVEL